MHKIPVSSILLIMLAGCSNPYTKFYTDYTQGVNVLEDQRFIVGTGKPTLLQGTTPEQDEQRMVEDNYVLLGASSFNGAEEDQRAAIQQAKKVDADTVIVYRRYTNTLSGSMPITTPDIQTSSHSGIIYGAGGTAGYFGSSTTYGSRTTYMPYNVNRYDYLVTFWIRAKPPRLGIVFTDLTPEERENVGSNKGVRVRAVIKNSPAFAADLVRGDIIRKFNDLEVIDTAHLSELAANAAGPTIRLEILRKGETIEKAVQLKE